MAETNGNGRRLGTLTILSMIVGACIIVAAATAVLLAQDAAALSCAEKANLRVDALEKAYEKSYAEFKTYLAEMKMELKQEIRENRK